MQLVKPSRTFVPVSKPRPGWEIRGRVNGVSKGGGGYEGWDIRGNVGVKVGVKSGREGIGD